MRTVDLGYKLHGYKIQLPYSHWNTEVISSLSTLNHLGFYFILKRHLDFPGGAVVKNPSANMGTRVRALVWEDPTCCGATKPVRHNY